MEQKEYKTAYEYYLSLPKYGKQQVLSYSGLTKLQNYIANKRKEKEDPRFIVCQKGAQEQMMATRCKEALMTGNRGGGKTFTMFMKMLSYINHPKFAGIFLRREKSDSDKAGGAVDTSREIFSQYGEFNESQSLRQWRFEAGGRLRLEHYSDALKDFIARVRGAQYAIVAIDEMSAAQKEYIDFLKTTLRNAYGLDPILIGAMNPNSESYLYLMIQWYLDDSGRVRTDRSGKIRYYYRYGDGDEDIVWGNTKREVYKVIKPMVEHTIDERLYKYGDPIMNMISEITFINCDLSENEILMSAQPDYLSNIGSGGDEESNNVDRLGIWKPIVREGDIITDTDMLNFFQNTPQYDDGMEYATLDPSYGGDFAVMCHWIGHHLNALEFTKDVDGETIKPWISANLAKWDLPENRLAFDAWGANAIKAKFKNAKPILGAVIDIRNRIRNEQAKFLYTDLKSQMADALIARLREKGYSINPALLALQYGNGTVRKTMMRQKSAIRFKPQTVKGKMSIIEKGDMKKLLGGGESPDLIEAILYREYWDLVKPNQKISKSKLNKLMFI